MTIIRDGVEYTLTTLEMAQAYSEWQRVCDIADVKSVIFDSYDAEDFFETFGVTQEQAGQYAEQIAHRKREYQDEGGDWIECARAAIEYYIDDIKED